ncbi:MAG TPA: toxin-antitoxin system protein [Eubacteriaceae bacterium]|nr:toxin-antitoxin system protein [Eubacteriaceae bacterium]
MSTITIRFNNDEEKIFTEYAKLHGIPLSTLFKKALEEKIEDEIDLKSILDYEGRRQKENDIELYTLEETKDLLDL